MAGRFLAVENGAAVFALPNDHHRRRCEESKTMVEAVLAAHLGRRIPVRLVVDPGSFPPDSPPEQGSPPSVSDEDIDLSELQDAPAALTSCIHHVTQAFPGAELVEE
jgi:DNA polymerase III subunit gamma/tau